MTNFIMTNDTNGHDHSYEQNIPAIVVFAIFVVVGIIGNSLIVYVYGFRFQDSTTRVFIVGLAIFDLTTCVLLPYKITLFRYPYLYENVHIKRLEIVRIYFLQVSVMILPLVSIDRYRRICRPFRKQISSKVAKILIVATCVVLATVTAFRLAVTEKPKGDYKAQAFVSSKYVNDKYNGTSLGNFYFVYTVLPFCIPLPVLIILYVLIGLKVRALVTHEGPSASNSLDIITTSSEGVIIDTDDDTGSKDSVMTAHGDDPSAVANDKMLSQAAGERQPLSPGSDCFTSECDADGIDIAADGTSAAMNNEYDRTHIDAVLIEETPDDVLCPDTIQGTHEHPVVLALKPLREEGRKLSAYERAQKKVKMSIGRMLKAKLQREERRTSVECDLHSRRKREQHLPWKRMTLIFFLITLVYFISFVPFFTLFILFRVDPESGNEVLSHPFFIVIYNSPYLTNISNCFLYGFFDPRFRRELRSISTMVNSSTSKGSKDQQLDSRSSGNKI